MNYTPGCNSNDAAGTFYAQSSTITMTGKRALRTMYLMRYITVTHLYDGNIQPGGDGTAHENRSGFSQEASAAATLRYALGLELEVLSWTDLGELVETWGGTILGS